MTETETPYTRQPYLGCIADDVTGATDLAINLAQGGMRVVQVLGVPSTNTADQICDVDAIVVALKTRSIPKENAIDQSIESARWLKRVGVERYFFKYCSTFDSTDRGNIGPVAEALMEELNVGQTIFCPAFPRAGRTVYRGHLFVGDQLLNESGMQNHPLNPMTDANLVRFLTKQSTKKVDLLSAETIRTSADACRDRLANLSCEDTSLVVTDACDDTDLATIADAVAQMRLVTGGSGLARYLPQAYRTTGNLKSSESTAEMPKASGRSLILAGSCSIATNAQVQAMQPKCPTWFIDVPAIVSDSKTELDRLKAWATKTDRDATLMVASTSAPDVVAKLQERFGIESVATAIESFLGAVAKMLVAQMNVRQLVLAGGETSGAIVSALGVHSLRIGPEICVGVPWTETIGHEPALAMALKSGNFGGEDFFSVALEMLS
ncbi:MAG: 3-oxo-tetronate kinase [Rubripirellula sp.]